MNQMTCKRKNSRFFWKLLDKLNTKTNESKLKKGISANRWKAHFQKLPFINERLKDWNCNHLLKNKTEYYSVQPCPHSVWIDATEWKFDNHTNLWKECYHNIFTLTFKCLCGSEATIAVFHPVKLGSIVAFGRIFSFFG